MMWPSGFPIASESRPLELYVDHLTFPSPRRFAGRERPHSCSVLKDPEVSVPLTGRDLPASALRTRVRPRGQRFREVRAWIRASCRATTGSWSRACSGLLLRPLPAPGTALALPQRRPQDALADRTATSASVDISGFSQSTAGTTSSPSSPGCFTLARGRRSSIAQGAAAISSSRLPVPEGIVVMALGIDRLPAGAVSAGLPAGSCFHRAGGICVALLAAAAVALGGFLKNAETT